ncbi:MAG: AtpZ/AtpI family protein [Catalinimonas sp.]
MATNNPNNRPASTEHPPDGKRKSPLKVPGRDSPYLRYAGMGFQMIAVLALAIWGGQALDGWLDLGFPWFTVVLSVAGFVGAIWSVINSLPKE